VQRQFKYLIVALFVAALALYFFNAIDLEGKMSGASEYSIEVEARSQSNTLWTNQYAYGGELVVDIGNRHKKFSNTVTSSELLTGNEEWQKLRFALPRGREVLKFRLQIESEVHRKQPKAEAFWLEIKGLNVLRGEEVMYSLSADEISTKLSPNKAVKKQEFSGGKARFSIQKRNASLEYKGVLGKIDVFKEIKSQGKSVYFYPLCFTLSTLLIYLLLYFSKMPLKPNMKLGDFALLILFLSVMTFVNVQIASPIVQTVNTEKRELYAMPKLDVLNFKAYLDGMSLFYRENFGFRNFLIKWNNAFKFNLYGVSPVPEEVVVGKEDWLFKTILVEDLVRTPLLTESQLDSLCRNVRKVQARFKKMGIKYYILLPTEKGSMYPEYLPKGLEVQHSLRRQVSEAIRKRTKVPVFDTEKLLRKHQKDQFLYYQYDFHWNEIAGFLVYKEFAEFLSKDFPSIKPAAWNEMRLVERVSKLKGLSYTISMQDELVEKERHVVPKQAQKWGEKKRIKGSPRGTKVSMVKDESLPKAIIVHDSFYSALYKHLANHFQAAIYIQNEAKASRPNIELEFIKREKPDMVIHEFMIHSEYDLVNLFGK